MTKGIFSEGNGPLDRIDRVFEQQKKVLVELVTGRDNADWVDTCLRHYGEEFSAEHRELDSSFFIPPLTYIGMLGTLKLLPVKLVRGKTDVSILRQLPPLGPSAPSGRELIES